MAYSNIVQTVPYVKGAGTDVLGRQRMSLPISIGIYKNTTGIAASTEQILFAGTGSVTSNNSQTILNVTAGQYLIAQSKEYHYYVAGSPQRIDFTYNNFQPQSGLIKRCIFRYLEYL